MRKSNESIPHWTSRNRISLSLFIHVTTLSSLCAALKKKERTTKRNPERRDDESTTLSLSLSSYLTSLVVFINNTPQFKDDFTFVLLLLRVKFFFLTSRRRELEKKKKTLNTLSSREAKDPMFHALKVEIPAQRHKTENTHNNMGVSILYVSNSFLFAHKRYPFRRIRRFRCDGTFARWLCCAFPSCGFFL